MKNKKQILLIGTNNTGKFREIKEALKNLPLKIIAPKDLKIKESPAETGSTYQENAKIKAEFFYKKTGLNILAEDSGIEVDYFKGKLGYKTRRWGKGPAANDKTWLNHFLKQMTCVPGKKRSAKFVCCAALVWNGKIRVFNGACKGKITRAAEAPILKGLPLSSCFKPNGCDKVYAALPTKEKNKISHRGKAIHKARLFIEKKLRAERGMRGNAG